MAPFARSAATAIPSELRNSSSALIAFRGSELSRRLAQNSKVGILVVIESVVVAYPFLGGLVRRPSFLSFRVTTTTSKPTCLRRRLQHTQLGTEISRLLSWPAS